MHYKKGMAAVWAILITLVIMLGLAGGAYYYFNQKFTNDKKSLQSQIDDLNKQIADLKKAATATTSTSSTSSTATTSANTYTDKTYNFTLTFNTKWAGWKIKTAHIDGSVITYYFEVPTSDTSNYGNASSVNDAGYASTFAISVYTKDQWAAVPTDAGGSDTKITENATYVFGWSHAQAAPDDIIAKGIWDDINNIIKTFKLN